ncbi:MAG: response regulator transcription factor [Campylobacterales bacterium]|nr:response regulator transcription factor [Campylobacterales bacterium]
MANILILEDDRLFNETLQDFLEDLGHKVSFALDPYTALDLSYTHTFDCYLFDVNLPYESGFELLSKLRDSGDVTPTIFMTSRDDKASLAHGFKIGGDDYIKKPIDLDELHFRLNALLKRTVRSSKIAIDNYAFDTVSKMLFEGNQGVELSQKASLLLFILIEAKGSVVSFESIESRLWAAGEESSSGAIRVYVTQIKKYFPHRIKNIRGVGYAFAL